MKHYESEELALGHSLDDYHFVTPNELFAMKKGEYKNLITLMYEEHKFKIADVSIYEYKKKKNGDDFTIEWQTYCGSPSICVSESDLDTPIEKESWDGEWFYSLLAPNKILETKKKGK